MYVHCHEILQMYKMLWYLEAAEDEGTAYLKGSCGVHQTSQVRCADTKVKKYRAA